jgi:epoxyqueuosine reductase
MKEAIRERARELGFDDCRFTAALPPESGQKFQEWLREKRHGQMGYLERNAHKRMDPKKVLPEAASVIVLAVSYAPPEEGSWPDAEPKDDNPQGLIARYARYADYHDIIGERLRQLVDFLRETAGPEIRSLWYVDTGPVLERDLAQRAGAGFIGKHTNLISRQLGNWIFLSEILTTLSLEPDEPEKNRCGTCSRCLEACPTGAIQAPFQLDARLCISYLTIELKESIPEELRPAIGNRIYGCDDCLAICPWNRFAKASRLMKDHSRPELSAPALIELLSLTESAFKQRFAGTPLLRAKRRGFLRNVCVALGNIGDERALPALKRAASDSEPLIAEHACWAIEQIASRASSG